MGVATLHCCCCQRTWLPISRAHVLSRPRPRRKLTSVDDVDERPRLPMDHQSLRNFEDDGQGRKNRDVIRSSKLCWQLRQQQRQCRFKRLRRYSSSISAFTTDDDNDDYANLIFEAQLQCMLHSGALSTALSIHFFTVEWTMYASIFFHLSMRNRKWRWWWWRRWWRCVNRISRLMVGIFFW